ncbi:S41 family peptidase [Acidobacteriota bacterium]
MKTKKFSIALKGILCVFLLCFPLLAEQKAKTQVFNPREKFAVKELKDDFRLLRTALEEGHGGLYRYTPKQELDQQFETILGKLTQPLTAKEFLLRLAPLIANINDGHTGLILSSPHVNYLKKQPIFFPFKLKFIKKGGGTPNPFTVSQMPFFRSFISKVCRKNKVSLGISKKRAYLFRNYSEHTNLVMGGEVISINGQPISTIIEKMLPILSSDGHIESSKYRRLESSSYFSRTYTILFGRTREYSIVYQPPGTKDVKTIKSKGLTQDQLNAEFEKRYPEAAKDKPPIELEYKGNIPVLTVRTFGGGYKKAGISYPEFIKNAFTQFHEKNIKNLVIDLRGNGGGRDEYGKILFAYLIDSPFQYYKHLEVKQNKHSFWPYTNVPEGEKELAASIKKNNRGTYDVDVSKHPNLGIQQPLKPTFKGNVFILIDGRSFSATGECTSLIHFYKKARFVGEECGAGYYGNTSGFMVLLTLPNTRLRIRIPMVKYAMAVSGYPPDRGIIPDYPVVPKMSDLLNGRDTEMEFVLKLIKEKL